MSNHRRRITSLVGLLTILLTGCELISETGGSPISPSTLASLLAGNLTLSSTGGTIASPESCTNFDWSISPQTATTYTGTFSATCAGGVQLDGTATGVLVDDLLNITATGTATLSDGSSCPFTLTGTARLEGSTVRIDYTGTTCLRPVSGTEILVASS